MKKLLSLLFVSAAISLAAAPADATLIDRGSGLIYDTDLDITWLADMNYANTTDYDDALYGFDTSGKMKWADAMAWANQLVYGGYNDWRLPTTPYYCNGYNCTNSEMGHLYYSELGGTGGASIFSSSDPDLSLFTNLQGDSYWSGTGDFANSAWYFTLYSPVSGYQNTISPGHYLYAMAVRTGDSTPPQSAPVPEPGTLLLMGSGFAGLALWRRRFGK